MTVFADMVDLRTAVVEHVASADIADVFPRLVKQAENRLNKHLRTRHQVTETTLTFAGGSATLPSDFAEMIGLYSAMGYEYVQHTLPFSRPNSYFYAVNGSAISATLLSGDLRAQYYAKLTPLTMLTSNWLLAECPMVYLYAVGMEAAKHRRDADLAQATEALLREAMQELLSDDFSARYARSRVRVGGCTP